MTFGEKVRICRKAFDLTQDDLAARLKTTKQVVSRHEVGIRVPKITAAEDYSKALNVPCAYLINPDIDFVLWEHFSLIEDYINSNDSQRIMLVERRGIDPRIAQDYAEIKGEAASPVFPNAPTREILDMLSDMTPEELALVKSRIQKIKESR